MFVHSKAYVTNVDEVSIQPNAVDLRVSSFAKIQPGRIRIGETTKQFLLRDLVDLQDDTYKLDPRSSYDFETDHRVTIPEGMVGWLVIRSTFARNGLLVGNGLYDSLYSGSIGGVIHNLTDGQIVLEKNIRIAQFVMAKAEMSHPYTGFYTGQNAYVRHGVQEV
jgi:deoxycytidine triphosphate deaminase